MGTDYLESQHKILKNEQPFLINIHHQEAEKRECGMLRQVAASVLVPTRTELNFAVEGRGCGQNLAVIPYYFSHCWGQGGGRNSLASEGEGVPAGPVSVMDGAVE